MFSKQRDTSSRDQECTSTATSVGELQSDTGSYSVYISHVRLVSACEGGLLGGVIRFLLRRPAWSSQMSLPLPGRRPILRPPVFHLRLPRG